MTNGHPVLTNRLWPPIPNTGFRRRQETPQRASRPQVVAQTPVPCVIPEKIAKQAERVVRDMQFMAASHGVAAFDPADRQRALCQDIAVAMNANDDWQVILEWTDSRNGTVERAVWRRGEAGTDCLRTAGESDAPVAAYELRLTPFTSRQLTLEAPRLHCRWARLIDQEAGPRPEGDGRPPRMDSGTATCKLRVHRTGNLGFAFAETLDDERHANVYCNVRWAPGIERFDIGDILTARLVVTPQGVQARDIRMA